MPLAAVHHKVNKRFERPFLGESVADRRRATIATPIRKEHTFRGERTEEVLQPRADVVIQFAFHVKKDVAGR
jgi:hypothetical protein